MPSLRSESHAIVSLEVDGEPVALSGDGRVVRTINQIDAGGEVIDGTWTWSGSVFTTNPVGLSERGTMKPIVMALDDGRTIRTTSIVSATRARNGTAISLAAGDSSWTED